MHKALGPITSITHKNKRPVPNRQNPYPTEPHMLYHNFICTVCLGFHLTASKTQATSWRPNSTSKTGRKGRPQRCSSFLPSADSQPCVRPREPQGELKIGLGTGCTPFSGGSQPALEPRAFLRGNPMPGLRKQRFSKGTRDTQGLSEGFSCFCAVP
jgi:hypothetical protein